MRAVFCLHVVSSNNIGGDELVEQEQASAIVQSYILELENEGYIPTRVKDTTSMLFGHPDDARRAGDHILWMLKQVSQFLEEGKIQKFDRWLGFVQGVMWGLNLKTIKQMRDENR